MSYLGVSCTFASISCISSYIEKIVYTWHQNALLAQGEVILGDAEQCPRAAHFAKAEVSAAIAERHCAHRAFAAAGDDSDTAVDELIGATGPFHALRISAHARAEADGSDRDRCVNKFGVFHSILSYG